MKVSDTQHLISEEGFCAAADQAGLSAVWLRQKVRDESISVKDFKRLLAAGGQDEKRWLQSPLEVLNILGPAPWRADNRPEIIRNLVSAARKLPLQEAALARPSESVFDCESASRADIRELVGDSARAFGAVYDLDEYRRKNPERALLLVRTLATHVAPRLAYGQAQIFAEAAVVLAMALRNTGQQARAREALRIGLIASERSALTMTSVRLLQRLAVLFGDRLDCDQALCCLDMAAARCLEKGDLVELTRTIAQRGITLTDAERSSEAKQYLNHAIRALGDDDNQYRGAVHHSLAVGASASGRREEAEAHLKESDRLLEGAESLIRACTMIQRGYLALAAKEPEVAVEKFLAAREMLKSNPLAEAAVTVELIIALGQAERFEEVRQEGRRIVFSLEPLSSSPQVAVVMAKVMGILSEAITASSLEGLSGAALQLRRAQI